MADNCITELNLLKTLILPSIPLASQATTAKAGMIGLSGTNLVLFNGSNWVIVS